MSDKKSNSLLVQLRDFGIGPIIGIFISMLTVPITTRLILPEEYGKSSLFTLVQNIFNILVLLGMDQSFVRFYNQKDMDKKDLLWNCLFYPSIFSIFVTFLFLIFQKSLSNFMFGSYEPIIMHSFIIYLPSLLLSRFALITIRMDLRGKVYSFLNIFQHILSLPILLIFLFFYERSFRSIVFSTVICSIINCIVCIIVSGHFLPLKKGRIDKQLTIQLFKYGLPLVPASLLSWIMNSFDKISIRSLSSFEELGMYAAAFKIVSLLNVFQTVFATAWTPVAFKWYEENTNRKQFEEVSSYVTAVMSLMFAAIIVFRGIIVLFLGEEYRNVSEILVFLLYVPVLYTISETTCLGINFSKKTVFSLLVSIIAAVLNVVGNTVLVPKFGALGAAISTAICYVAFFWCRTLFSRKLGFKIKLNKFYLNTLFLILFSINMLTIKNKLIEVLLLVIMMLLNFFILLPFIKERIKK